MPDPLAAALPDLAEVRGWIGYELDDAGGDWVGRVEGVYADAEGGAPAWVIVGLGRGVRRRFTLRRRSPKAVAVPVRECAAMPGRVWTAQATAAMRSAPAIDPTRPLLREHEIAICAHYGIGEGAGRHAEVAARGEGSVTAQPV